MNRKPLVMLAILTFAALLMPISSVLAESPMIDVSGTIKSSATSATLTKQVGENSFYYITTASTWSGGISGATVGSQTWIVHTGGDDMHRNINVEIYFQSATVDGKTGSMTIEMNNIGWQGHPEDNHGTWRIVNATDGLEGLHGEGEWVTTSGNTYAGTVHFS